MSVASEADVVVVGAGAAGIGAGLALADSGLSFIILEARDRVGGRAHTLTAAGLPLDFGCGWLHAAAHNPWVARFEALGLEVDRSDPPWGRPSSVTAFRPGEQADYRVAFAAFDQALEDAAERIEQGAPDVAASTLLPPGGRWNPLLDAFSGYYNGAPFSEISVQDYGRFDDKGGDWRMAQGYGAAIAYAAGALPVRLGAQVTRIDHRGPRLRVETAAGAVQARAVIVTLPTDLIAGEAIAFNPPLPDKLAAAAALPLGFAAKAFLGLSRPDAVPVEQSASGRTDSARTASHHFRPLGRPYVESYFGDGLAHELEHAGPGALHAFAVEQLVGLLGSDIRATLTPLAETRWSPDPFSRGAYSHARVGAAAARARLAEAVDGRLFFAGEACSERGFSTAHGAYETGVRAAKAAATMIGGC